MERESSLNSGRLIRRALMVGSAGLILLAFGGTHDRGLMLRSYLVAYQFYLAIALGSLPLVMIYHLTGGGWGIAIRRLLEAATRTLPLLALLIVPLLLSLKDVYHWADPDAAAVDPSLAHKSIYLNVPFFMERTAIYFLIWIAMAGLLNRWSRQQDATDDPRPARRMAMLSGPGLVLYGLTVTFAAVDWVMSLEPDWFSTIFPAIFGIGQVLAGLAFAVAAAALLAWRRPHENALPPIYLRDLGNLLLTFVMLWSYVAFSQFLLIWTGNLPEEIRWYLPRFAGGWQMLGWGLVVCQFALPFLLLLSRDVKQNPRSLIVVSGLVLVMRLIDLFWQIVPSFPPHGLTGHLSDVVGTLVAFLGIGGVWLAAFVWQLNRMPLLPVHDSELATLTTHPE